MTEAVRQIVKTVSTYDPAADVALIERCFDFASERHAGQRRRSGEPYVVHPVGVARIISDLRLDVASVCAGLLHDCVEDTSATAEDIGRLFGQEIQFLVEGVTKLGQIPWTTREERQAENFRKMLLAMARDIRVILIKLADRVDNMRTLQYMSRDKQERIANETLEIYAPLANRLGIQWMKIELEDLAFRYVEPQAYADLVAKMTETEEARDGYIAEVVNKLKSALDEAGIHAQVSGRAKHLWSIFQKMRKTGRDVEQIYDVIAFRVIVDSVQDCYGTLGIVHSNWTPIPGRFKDFIALPKPNLYQSLHTTVIGPRSDRMEVQIRNQEMHRIADQGIAAHWQYKEKVPMGAADGQAFAWLRQLMEWQRDLKDPTEFIETVKIDLFQDEVFVFTPKGDVKALPKGSTPIDFAYSIHSKVGDSCSGARINGLIVPLRYQLRNGDTIDILTSPNQKPSKDWLKFVATSRAKTKIRHFIRMEQRERSRQMGHDLLARELRKRGFGLATMERDGRVAAAADRLHVGAAEDLLVAVGYGRLTVDQAANAIAPSMEPETTGPAAGGDGGVTEAPITGLRRAVKRAVGGIRVQGQTDILVKFAKCCSPVPGDPIIGFISRGHGVAIHAPDCERAMALDPARRLEVSWDIESKTLRPVTVEVQGDDRPGLLASISRTFTESGVNISQAKCRTSEDGKAVNTFQVSVAHVDQLKAVLRTLQSIEGVVSAARR
ncbi:MAG: bifunctional (p)ppGpp synthetase/guanosine-3',5'-bis(diphosphate) 3'-pyrophosphohydrolase [Verrucomicrobiota bacterium]